MVPGGLPNTIVDWEKFDSSKATLKQTEDKGMEYIDKIIFLGDSTTNGLRAYGVLTDGINTKQVWTGTSGTLTLDNKIMNTKIFYPDMGKEVTIVEAVADKKPEILVITLGVNGISFSSEEQFKTNYTNLVVGIKNASPSTKIILQSIFPVTKTYDENPEKRIKNEKIRAANEWILSIAEKEGCKFLNTTSVLQDETGSLILKYCNDAELHLNETGLLTELQYIRTHGYAK